MWCICVHNVGSFLPTHLGRLAASQALSRNFKDTKLGNDFNEFTVCNNTGFRPACYSYIESLRASELVLYHDQYGLRHPVSAYNNSLSRVENGFVEVLNLYDGLRASKGLFHDAGLLLDKYRQLYYALAEHFEACEGVAKSFVAKQEYNKHPVLKKFRTNEKAYKHVDHVINEVKHRQSEFVPLKFTSDRVAIYGFIVSGIRGAGTIGPNLNLHKQWRCSPKIIVETAFSFNRDLRHIFVDIFRVGAFLGEAMAEFGVIAASSPKREGSKLIEIASRITGIPDFGFPDELEEKRYIVKLEGEGDLLKLRVGNGGRYNLPQSWFNPAKVELLIMLNAELSHIVPYFPKDEVLER